MSNIGYSQKYEYWLTFDDNTKNELESITDKKRLRIDSIRIWNSVPVA